MLKKDKLVTPPDKVNTVIGKDTTFRGSLKGKGLIRIDGEMEGDISTQGDVVIGESGRVVLDLKARNVSVAGRLQGSVEAEGKMEIRSSGVVLGDVKVNGLLVDEGAIISGNIEMKGKAQETRSSKKTGVSVLTKGTDGREISNL